MKIRRVLLSVFLAVMTISAASAQITINQGSLPGFGASFTSYAPGVSVTLDVGSAGANQSWSVPETQVVISGFTNVVSPGETQWGGDFPTATHAYMDAGGTTASYSRIASNGSYSLGFASSSGGLTEIQYDPEGLSIAFPCTYNTSWTYLTRYTTDVGGGISVTSTDSVLYQVDGWGTMTTQFGTDNVLRIKGHRFLTSVTTLPPPLPPQTVQHTSYNYQWLAANGTPVVSMYSDPGETDPNFTDGTIYWTRSGAVAAEPVRGPVADNFSIGQNYPNPFNPTTTLPISVDQATKVEVIVYNELGEVVMQEAHHFGPGEHVIPFDGSQWSSGSYFARVTAGNLSQTKRMTLVK